MDVSIGELSSTVRAVDGDTVLSPRAKQQIVAAVLVAVREDRDHDRRVRAEKRITGGVSEEQAEETA